MNKKDWDAIDPRQRDEVVALTVMGWDKSILQNIDAQLRPPGAAEDAVDMVPNYTTDRNACALVLDEIERRGLMFNFVNWLNEEIADALDAAKLTLPAPHLSVEAGFWAFLTADPDTICYCAVKACEETE